MPFTFTNEEYKMQNELSALLENIPLQTQLQMHYQHYGAPSCSIWISNSLTNGSVMVVCRIS